MERFTLLKSMILNKLLNSSVPIALEDIFGKVSIEHQMVLGDLLKEDKVTLVAGNKRLLELI